MMKGFATKAFLGEPNPIIASLAELLVYVLSHMPLPTAASTEMLARQLTPTLTPLLIFLERAFAVAILHASGGDQGDEFNVRRLQPQREDGLLGRPVAHRAGAPLRAVASAAVARARARRSSRGQIMRVPSALPRVRSRLALIQICASLRPSAAPRSTLCRRFRHARCTAPALASTSASL